jgi:N-acetylneuraminate synthase/N,N'-diacetyllegionaminate synthase
MVEKIRVGKREIGPGEPCFVIAEAGVNHNGDIEMAHRLIDAAAESEADAVKFQTFSADRLVTVDAPKAEYQIETTGGGESQYEMLKRLELSPDVHQELMDHCAERDILFLSTPFDEQSANLLNDLHIAAFKIPSGEITNLPFLRYVARFGKPMIISTGMATFSEVNQAVRTVHQAGNGFIAVLHCVSSYPTAPEDVNLRSMEMLRVFKSPVGFSDHTLGIEIPLAAVALGAEIIEKHFTLDRSLPGPDHRASLEPGELAALVTGIRKVEAALGERMKMPRPSEKEVAAVVRKSLVAACDIEEGAKITAEMIAIKRPGTGLSPALYDKVIGRAAKVPISKGTLITKGMVGLK